MRCRQDKELCEDKQLFFSVASLKTTFKPGVSNTRTAGPYLAYQMYLCGPRKSQNLIKLQILIKFGIYLKLAFLAICGPHKLFSIKLRPAEHFFFRMWPSNQFEFCDPCFKQRVGVKVCQKSKNSNIPSLLLSRYSLFAKAWLENISCL